MAQVLPTGRIDKNRAPQNEATMKHKTFTLPYHSSFAESRSTEYHQRLNPTKSRQNAVTYPQTGLGG